MADTNIGGTGSSGAEAPKLVEVEIDGKKVMVNEDIREYVSKGVDYTKKTQKVAEERRALEAERESLKGELDAARGILGYLSNDDKAAKVMEALVGGDEKRARELLGEEGSENDLEAVKRELRDMKTQLKNKEANDANASQRTAQYAEAKRRALAEYGLDLDKYYPQMMERGMKDKNPFLPWLVTTALDEIKEKARSEGRKLGTEDALKELSIKLDNTPQISGGSGGSGSGKKKTQIETIADALNKLQEEKVRQSMA